MRFTRPVAAFCGWPWRIRGEVSRVARRQLPAKASLGWLVTGMRLKVGAWLALALAVVAAVLMAAHTLGGMAASGDRSTGGRKAAEVEHRIRMNSDFSQGKPSSE